MHMEPNAFHQGDMDLIGNGDGTDEISSALACLLGDGNQWRDVVTRMAEIRGQEGIVKIQFSDGCGIGPGRPFGVHSDVRRKADQCRAVGAWMGQGHGTGRGDWAAVDSGECHRHVIDDTAAHHFGDILGN